MVTTERPILSDDILARCQERAPMYDEENRFFQEDFDELKEAGYLVMAVPEDLGGRGMRLPEVARETRRLAYHASATALALNMHIYWTGLAADLRRSGDDSMEWLLKEAADGAVFAAGHAERGNDLPGLLSTTKAERDDGGYRFTGHKTFGSLTPVWTYLGLHGMDTSDPDSPKIVHGFLHRDAGGFEIVENWDVLGMRATRSDDTVLKGAFVPDKHIPRVVPAGFAGADNFLVGLFAWGLTGFGNVYYGIAQRAFDITIESVKKKTSLAMTRSMAYHPGVQHAVADMVIELESIGPQLEKMAQDWADDRVDYGEGWFTKILSTKYRAVEGSWRVVDLALEIAGGFGISKQSGLERLFRDARLGRIHPTNAMLTRELLGKVALGIDLDEQPRWG
jgi:alkylation response protein AidB-like acyl-CoA dehydrogenase